MGQMLNSKEMKVRLCWGTIVSVGCCVRLWSTVSTTLVFSSIPGDPEVQANQDSVGPRKTAGACRDLLS